MFGLRRNLFCFVVVFFVHFAVWAGNDGPFPMDLATGRWMLNNDGIELEIRELRRFDTSSEVYVVLRDAVTGCDLASGWTLHQRRSSQMQIRLYPLDGGEPVLATFDYDYELDMLVMDGTCHSCRLRKMTD